MNTDAARTTVRDLHNNGAITYDERITAMREISAGRADAAIALLNTTVAWRLSCGVSSVARPVR